MHERENVGSEHGTLIIVPHAVIQINMYIKDVIQICSGITW